MIKQLRKRFIFVAMLSVVGVTLLLVLATNIVNLVVTTGELDSTLALLATDSGRFVPPDKPPPAPPEGESGQTYYPKIHAERESLYGARFYVVEFDGSGGVTLADVGKIASVTQTEAISNARAAVESGRAFAYDGSFRRLVTEDGGKAVFLYCGDELKYMSTVALVSCGVLLFVCAMTFLPLAFLSRRIVRPFVENAERQRQFITNASHELMTPLTVISANADMLDITFGKSEWNDSSRRQVDRLRRLVNELVELSRADELAQTRRSFEPFDMSEAVLDAACAFEAVAEASGRALKTEIPPKIIIKGDESGARQLVSLLLDNAVKYSDAGSDVRISLTKRKKGAALSVANACERLEKSDAPRLFDRFYRADKARTQSAAGFGIGLSIARAIVESHNGTIEARAQDGELIITAFLPG